MRTFELYTDAQGDCRAIKKGFSWPGFFFGAIWAFAERLWGIASLLVLVFIILRFIEGIAEDSIGLMFVVLALHLGVSMFVAFQGNEWKRRRLLRKGYTLTKTVEAKNPDAAIAALLEASAT